MLVTTSKLTPGIRLIIGRRRRGLTQLEEAKRRHKSLYRYRQWENDATDVMPKERLNRLADHEQCFALRVLEGTTLYEQAKTMRVSRWWLRQMERGTANVSRLVEYWYWRIA